MIERVKVFACVETEQAWQIKISDLRNWISKEKENPPVFEKDGSIPKYTRAELIEKAVHTEDSMRALAQALSNLK